MGYFDSLDALLRPPTAPPAPPSTNGQARSHAGASGGVSDADRAWAEAALRSECEVVANTPEGGRDDALNTAWFRMGQLDWCIDRERARADLTDAALRTGQPMHDIQRALRDGSTGGYDQGMLSPRHPTPRPEHGVTVLPELGVPESQWQLANAPELAAQDEADFWKSRDLLKHIHTFARARMVAPWAVLGCVLARIVTATPTTVLLPPIVGSKQSLNLFVGLVGPSGSGKGAAEAVAAEALHVGYVKTTNTGSGEGIAHGYMHREKGELVWNTHNGEEQRAVLFSVPEIDSLAAQGDRKGATLMPQLRSGWTGEQLGFGYADPLKRIEVPAHEYRLCLVAGIQPGRAGCLLNDSDGGTPQRFLWLPATDPDIPDVEPETPDPATWRPPFLKVTGHVGGTYVKVCELAVQTIKHARRARVRGDGDALDGHALLAQLKTAAALGIADGRYSVTEEDWRLAGVISAKSAATRAGVVRHLADKVISANVGRALGDAERAIVVEEKVADKAIKRTTRAIVRRLSEEGDWLRKTPLSRSVPGRDRDYFDEAVGVLLETGQIEVERVGERGGGSRFRLK